MYVTWGWETCCLTTKASGILWKFPTAVYIIIVVG